MPFLTLMTNIKAANLPADLMPKWVNVNATSSYDCHNYLLIMVHDIKWLLPFFVAQELNIYWFLVLWHFSLPSFNWPLFHFLFSLLLFLLSFP